MTPADDTVYGLLAEFESPEALLAAARSMKNAGVRGLEAYTPFPVKGLDELVKLPRRHWLRWIVFIGGVVGGLSGFAMEYYSAVISYPLNIGGRPPDSWPAFIPITFELTVLGAATFGLIGLLWLTGLPLLFHPVFSAAAFKRVTSDRFFLLVPASDPNFQRERIASDLDSQGALSVTEVDRSA